VSAAVINVAIKYCHINKIFYSRFARPLRGKAQNMALITPASSSFFK
jgi:hypothetical protein